MIPLKKINDNLTEEQRWLSNISAPDSKKWVDVIAIKEQNYTLNQQECLTKPSNKMPLKIRQATCNIFARKKDSQLSATINCTPSLQCYWIRFLIMLPVSQYFLMLQIKTSYHYQARPRMRLDWIGVILSQKCVRFSDVALDNFFFRKFISSKALKICYEHRGCSDQRCSL